MTRLRSQLGLMVVALLLSICLSTPTFASTGTHIGGLLTSNLLLDKAHSPYVLTSTVEIPTGMTVAVDPGVVIDANGVSTMFWEQGNLLFNGSSQEPIRLIGKPDLYVSIKNTPASSRLKISHVFISGGGTVWSTGGYEGSPVLTFEDSEVKDLSGYFYVWYFPGNLVIQRNVFINSGGLSIGFDARPDHLESATVKDNLFIGPSRSGYWVEVWASYGGQVEVHGNEFRGGPYTAVQLKPNYGDVNLNASGNFWNTQSSSTIASMVNDKSDGLSYQNAIDASNPLSAPTMDSPKQSILLKEEADEAAADKAAADKAAADKAAADKAAADKAAADKAALNRKITITCLKGKSVKKVLAKNPACPKGFVKKK